jgi:hypothetical protein
MAIARGFIQSIEVRDDGVVEFIVQAVHAGNTTQSFFIEDLDGAVEKVNRRLAQLGLLRDALARVLPVEVDYEAQEAKGNIVLNLTIRPRPSLDGRQAARRVQGVVVGISLFEYGPSSTAGTYLDLPDLAAIMLLSDTGSLEQFRLDLQRPDPLTGQSMLRLLEQAHRTRRVVALAVSMESSWNDQRERSSLFKQATTGSVPGFIQACEWPTVPEETLDYVYAFIERLGQRYESYESTTSWALSWVRVVYTTAPGQTPEGDVSDNGGFAPQTSEAWVHSDSPLFHRLEVALRDRLQVKLGLSPAGSEGSDAVGEITERREVHEVELVGHLGTAARPVWIEMRRCVNPEASQSPCANIPTIQAPDAVAFSDMPVSYCWKGRAYFNEGIWRFVLRCTCKCTLLVDGKPTCSLECGEETPACGFGCDRLEQPDESEFEQYHAFLNGVHAIDLTLAGRRCGDPFELRIYRIR